MTKPARIVLLHATPVAVEPINAAMARLWPGAEVVNLLDDGLTIDRAREGDSLSEDLIDRFVDLGRYALRIGANGILVTCSAFGPAIDRLEDIAPVPVLRPNEAMFRSALDQGGTIGMLATFAPAVPTMEAEFQSFSTDGTARLTTHIVPEAIDLLRRGDAEAHNRLVAGAAPALAATGVQSIMLAHFSTSRALAAVQAAVDIPVFTAPDAAVVEMKRRIGA